MKNLNRLIVGVATVCLLAMSGCATQTIPRLVVGLCKDSPLLAATYVRKINQDLDERWPGTAIVLRCPSATDSITQDESI